MRVRKISGETLYFIFFVAGIVLLAWILKNFIKAGDEVIAGISAALITLLGVKLTNKNSQVSLDKQLKHQSDTFQVQMKDQADGFIEQMKHQNEMLEKQMKHQSEENEKERKQKFKHDQYIELIKGLSEIQNYFTAEFFLNYEPAELPKKLSVLKGVINVAKLISSKQVADQLDEIHTHYYEFVSQLSRESRELLELNHQSGNVKAALELIRSQTPDIYKEFFKDGIKNSDLELLESERNKLLDQLKLLDNKVLTETQRLIDLLKPKVKEIKLLTSLIVVLVNLELGYSEINEY